MNNPGGDQGDGTMLTLRCPKCKELFFDWEVMRSHIDWENEQVRRQTER